MGGSEAESAASSKPTILVARSVVGSTLVWRLPSYEVSSSVADSKSSSCSRERFILTAGAQRQGRVEVTSADQTTLEVRRAASRYVGY